VVKVIDFGIAKATGQQVTDKTLEDCGREDGELTVSGMSGDKAAGEFSPPSKVLTGPVDPRRSWCAPGSLPVILRPTVAP
jgi:hypothetical protein